MKWSNFKVRTSLYVHEAAYVNYCRKANPTERKAIIQDLTDKHLEPSVCVDHRNAYTIYNVFLSCIGQRK